MHDYGFTVNIQEVDGLTVVRLELNLDADYSYEVSNRNKRRALLAAERAAKILINRYEKDIKNQK